VLHLADPECEHDVSDPANHGEGRDPGDEENGADTVSIAGRCSVSGRWLRKVSSDACDSQRSKMMGEQLRATTA
jgi:hypothetical protein